VLYAVLVNIGAAFTSGVAQYAVLFGVAGTLAFTPTETMSDEAATRYLLAVLAAIPAGIVASVVVLKLALPTTFWRAALVSFFQFLLSLLLALTIGLAIAGFVIATGGPTPPSGGWVR
jgi:hypothetical protein